ncbi:MAG: PAS domain S-box protein [Deltaproteobacteria bacterium]|jgi:PAS domain S-box-containing protein|nr:PAS domain S-box protein [Deltaproteobacteria bacterium]
MSSQTESNLTEESPLYNIRIVKSHIDYVRKVYPEIDIDEILNYSGITRLQYNDLGYWCNQIQMNRFYEVLVEKTGNKEISKDTGRSLMTSQNIIAQYVLGFRTPISVAMQTAHIYSKLSRGATAWGKIINDRKVELYAEPISGVKEEKYQCDNRIGCIEAIYNFFTCEGLRVQHPECYHHGAKFCRYIVSWDKQSKVFKWLRIRNYIILVGIIFSLLSLLGSFINFILVSLISISVSLALILKVQILKENKLTENVDELGKTAEEFLDELNLRYTVTKLVQEVGEITSVIQSEKEITSAVSKAMSRDLNYQRGVILLAEEKGRSLYFASGYGLNEKEVQILKGFQFDLVTTIPIGIIQKVFNKQEPLLISETDEIISSLGLPNAEILKSLNVRSLVCVPIIYEGKSLGILAVDRLISKRELNEGDINLLMAVASQIALNIAHARAYQNLQESEKKHRILIETIRDIVYTVDLQNRFTYISPIIENITGYTYGDLRGKQFYEIVSPKYKDIVKQEFSEYSENEGLSTYQVDILIKDGSVKPFELNIANLSNSTGEPIGRIGVARDITRRREEEAKRKEMEVRALTQNKLASLGEIATGVAHEINQPLSYINIILQTTLDDLSKEKLNTEELKEEFQESLRQVSRITKIISHLRTFGRTDITSFGPVDLAAVVHDTLILMKERLRIKNIQLNLDISDSFPMVCGNHIKLEQVFLNLIQNSMDVMEEQGGGEINLQARKEDDYALISFSDTGGGIAAELQEKIFEPFFTTKEAGKGTGIGLSIVYGIIQEYNGSIICESEEGKGATFNIKLPVYKSESDNMAAESLDA